MKQLLCVAALIAFAIPAAAGVNQSGLSFDHRLHVEDVGIECTDCHGDVASSTSLHETLRPAMSVCADCHDVEDVDLCGDCHLEPDNPTGYEGLVSTVDLFSHASHVGDMECAKCHGGAPEYSARPVKSECRSCHLTVANLEDCSLCHSKGRENVPESHEGMWEYWHGVAAGSDVEDCTDCHVQDDCEQCHAGDNVRPRVHPLNFEFNHSLEAKASRIECGTCHMDPQFCGECHAANLIIPGSHADPGWRSGPVHGPEALFEIESCISCHDAGEAVPATCGGLGCHVGG
jgi:hypothetical protein